MSTRTRYISEPFDCLDSGFEAITTLRVLEWNFIEALKSFAVKASPLDTYLSISEEMGEGKCWICVTSPPIPQGLANRMKAFEEGFRLGLRQSKL